EMAETQTPLSTLLIKHRYIQPGQLEELAEQLKSQMEEEKQAGSSIQSILLEEGVLGENEIERATEKAREEGIRFSQSILELDLVSLPKIAEIFKKRFGIDTVMDLGTAQIEFQVVNLVPDNLMKTHELLPFKRKGKKLHLAMSDPRNSTVIRKIEMITTLEVVPYLADRRVLLKRLEEFVVAPAPVPGRGGAIAGDSPSFQQLLDSDSAVKMVNKIVEGALNTHATDIHVEPQEKGLRIRYRIDGMLYDIMTIPRDMGIPTVSRLKVMSGMDVTERRRSQDGHASYELNGQRYDMRAATLPTHLGEKVVLRILDESSLLKGLNQLGFEEGPLNDFKKLIHLPYGMVLVTGPIGSGKTTTLYTALSEINHQSRNIVTLEDPVEYQLPGINQVQINPKIELSFANGLRSILRQDANVLLVGEIRDAETAATAIRAANTGHLLFSTLHTNYAVSAITALHHLGVPRFQIATALQGVVAQRLVRLLDPDTKVAVKPSPLAQKILGIDENTTIYEPGRDSTAGLGTGYSGREGVYEVFVNSEAAQDAIISGESELDVQRVAVEKG
ncbi:MAG: Flp pilus assembly complex ATPase component TadA, partial [Candidatus Omnitrophica bacterium]|nr:Flp pilus assembly complex ATPase component TadA [Candidatus Omnitrophota bacterium]